MKQNLVDKPVQNQVVCGHICGKNRTIGLKFWLNSPKHPGFQVYIANKTFGKKSEHRQNLKCKGPERFVQHVQHPRNSKPTWGNKLLKKGQKSWRTDEFSSVLEILLQKNFEESSDHNRNFDCDKTESPRSTCANYRQFGVQYAEKRPII